MTGRKGQRKRFWSDEEKRSICRQTRAPGVSVAQVARRYAMNSNLIFTWLRDPRFTPAEVDAPGDSGDSNLFLPVEIVGSVAEPEPGPDLETHGPAGDMEELTGLRRSTRSTRNCRPKSACHR